MGSDQDAIADWRASPEEPEDAVLTHMHQAEQAYRQVRTHAEQRTGSLRAAQDELARLRGANALLATEIDDARWQLAQEREQRQRQQQHSTELEGALREIHRALFGGNTYELILRASLTITHATRGLYVTGGSEDNPLRIRAALDVDGYPQAPPSPFIVAMCRRVLERNESFLANSPDELAELPQPAQQGEDFRNCIAVPVVLLEHLSGVIIAADKAVGGFDDRDAGTLLSVGEHAGVALENVSLRRELQGAYITTVRVLADAMEAKDPYTQGHCDLVSHYASLTGARLGLSPHDRSVLYHAALLHDIGKIGVSDGVLNKPGPLLVEERSLVRSHVRVGHDLICNVPGLSAVAEAVLHHHECYDGSGYPDGLASEAIPITARIVCAVDAYCAMISKRSYKEAYSDDQARDELRRCAGTQFDPRVVEALLVALDAPEAEDGDTAEYALLPRFHDPRR